MHEPSGVSPSGSVNSMPSCLPFPWFGERSREKEEEGERGRERLRSVSSSSLPYLTTTCRRDQVKKSFCTAIICTHAILLLYPQPPDIIFCSTYVIQTEIIFKSNTHAWLRNKCEVHRQQVLFLLVPEYWLSNGKLQHGGSCL